MVFAAVAALIPFAPFAVCMPLEVAVAVGPMQGLFKVGTTGELSAP